MPIERIREIYGIIDCGYILMAPAGRHKLRRPLRIQRINGPKPKKHNDKAGTSRIGQQRLLRDNKAHTVKCAPLSGVPDLIYICICIASKTVAHSSETCFELTLNISLLYELLIYVSLFTIFQLPDWCSY